MGTRKYSILNNLKRSAKSKATNAWTQAAYQVMWGEEAPKGKRRVNVNKKKS